MYNEDDLNSAVAEGIFDAGTAESFRQHARRRASAPAASLVPTLKMMDAPASGSGPDTTAGPDEENFRLVTGFNDIFVVIACSLLLVSVGWIVGAASIASMGLLGVAAASWGLAEFFTRRRHMALPSIFLLLTFAGSLFAGLGMLLKGDAVELIGSASLTALATWLHWRRFRVPISVAAGAAAAVGCTAALVVTVFPAVENWLSIVLGVAGLAVFALAMRWDATDTLRRTFRSDVAFWLHLLAAPLLVHPVFAGLGIYGGAGSLTQTAVVVLLYLLIALVSLAIDRRALMVSALAYVLYAFSALFKAYGMVSIGFALTALAIGSALLLLSAFWQHSRGAVLKYFPPALQRRLPPSR